MRLYSLLLLQFLSFSLLAQDSTIIYNVGVQLAASTAQTPFWMHVNQNGIIPVDGSFISGQWGISKIYHPNNPRKLQWSGKLELITNQSQKTDVFLSSAFLAVRIDKFELSVGQKSNLTGLMDTTLSLGSMAASNNARFFPSLQLTTQEYITLPFFNRLISLKASYSDGLLRGSRLSLGSVPSTQQTYFHQKSLYFKFGNANQPFKIWFGVNHEVVWGGEKDIWPIYKYKQNEIYQKIVLGIKRDNRLFGNHFGTYDLGFSVPISNWRMFAYKQSIFDNGSLFKIRNLQDGIIGLSLKNNSAPQNSDAFFRVSTLLIEFLSTANQQNFFNSSSSVVDNLGNYYNSYLYQNGWSYLGRNIGNALIPAKNTTQKKLPQEEYEFTNNNRINAIHFGAKAKWNRFEFTLKSTYSNNRGTLTTPFQNKTNQFSLFLKTERMLPVFGGVSTFLNISSDIGGLYPKSTGVSIGLKKQGFLD